jgi:hypothetical protein
MQIRGPFLIRVFPANLYKIGVAGPGLEPGDTMIFRCLWQEYICNLQNKCNNGTHFDGNVTATR